MGNHLRYLSLELAVNYMNINVFIIAVNYMNTKLFITGIAYLFLPGLVISHDIL